MSKKKSKKNKKETIKEKKKYLNINDETKRGVIVVLLFALAIIFVLSFESAGGVLGKYLLTASRFLFGKCLWLMPLAFIAGGIAILKEIHKNVYLSTLLGLFLFLLCFLAIVETFSAVDIKNSGWFGYLFSWPFLNFIGKWASLVVFVAGLLVSVLVAFNIPLKKVKKEEEASEKEEIAVEKLSKEIKGIGFDQSEKRVANLVKGIFSKTKIDVKKLEEEEEEKSTSVKATADKDKLLTTIDIDVKDYTFPPVDLLEEDKGHPTSGDIKQNQLIIQKTLENFGIPVEMAEVNVGPTVTQYTFRPAGGVKLSKITTLHRDISLALAAHPIRIEAPIPGRSLVGIEIPNKVPTFVRLRNMFEEYERKNGHHLNLALGRDVTGASVWTNLMRMPHMLIAGATGTGKSVCVNALITSLLYQKAPWELKFILIDPKRVELPLYNGIPHLLAPVIVDVQKTVNAFKWAIKEMEERYKLLAGVGSRDLASYNEKMLKKSPKEILPFIVIVVDELADIMMAYGKEVEGLIVRLAQMSRAVGIHLVLSTQRPSVEVITGLIKANITCRIAFQVAQMVDSRTILDMSGAEKLLGNGDMLFIAGDVGKPRRIQGVFVSEKEVQRVVKFLKKEAGEIEYEEEITKAPEEEIIIGAGGSGSASSLNDPLLGEAKELVIKTGKASASYLQRMFRIGYARAASLLDMLEMQGIVGPAEGAKPREVLIAQSKNQFSETEEDLSDLDEAVKKNINKKQKEVIEKEIEKEEEQVETMEEDEF
ncbi:MAG TPA: DNA translocase FtsK [Candidatus Portnoybacteria bacterium]|jgi:DNA segregation ATPase FtsK/SpoIIIE, S-DNA-T family|nr:DNA translocase FtsK [Candidatus Portnoybacteria bacterium]MDD5752275.1 DNA translocase FtsK [Candidatus Portnoybacteria bacterium]HOZ16347.1 DNA translocase FtsK [Candidatus Portnoybacteria bacterium]HPH52222.1 DNA translocase FtsK [Candidatus Portnoybacteria bacterium]HPJ80442.1 DNA translocase FtsK [Candidatus Portnoybacteria bacterium]